MARTLFLVLVIGAGVAAVAFVVVSVDPARLKLNQLLVCRPE